MLACNFIAASFFVLAVTTLAPLLVITAYFFIVVIRVYLPPARFYITNNINVMIKTDCAIAQPIFSVFVISLIDEMKVNPNTILRKTIIIPANAILKGFLLAIGGRVELPFLTIPIVFNTLHPAAPVSRFRDAHMFLRVFRISMNF